MVVSCLEPSQVLDRRTAAAIPESVDAIGCGGGIGAGWNFSNDVAVTLLRANGPLHPRHVLCRLASLPTSEGIEMNFSRATVAALLLATIGASGANAQTAKTGSAEPIQVGNVPDNLKIPAGNHAFFVGHGVGTQNYVCALSAASASGVAYTLFTPQATLFSDDLKPLTAHFFSPSPTELNTNPAVIAPGPIRVTWRHSRDASTVWGRVRPADPAVPGDLGDSSTDANFVAVGAVAWLKVTATAHEAGPTGGDTLTKTTFIQRLNTAGGLAPSTGCAAPTDVGHQAFVPYKADYFFYTDQ